MRSPLRVSRYPRRPLPARHRLDRAVGADLTDRPSVVATFEWPQVDLSPSNMPAPDCWRPNGAHPASCSALEPILAMRTDACHRRESLRALTTHDPPSALAWYPMAHQKRAMRRTPERRSPRLARSTTDTGFLGLGSGDRFGAPRGGSGSFKARGERAEKPARLRGKRATKRLSQVT
jgi:hypothetical protein